MKTTLTHRIKQTLVYFFTPEDSSAPAFQGTPSFESDLPHLGLGSVKAMFWVLGTVGVIYLIALI